VPLILPGHGQERRTTSCHAPSAYLVRLNIPAEDVQAAWTIFGPLVSGVPKGCASRGISAVISPAYMPAAVIGCGLFADPAWFASVRVQLTRRVNIPYGTFANSYYAYGTWSYRFSAFEMVLSVLSAWISPIIGKRESCDARCIWILSGKVQTRLFVRWRGREAGAPRRRAWCLGREDGWC
jgi:hypothetical protein